MNDRLLPLLPWMKSVVWGSDSLQTRYGKDFGQDMPLGESWEASAVPGHESKVGVEQCLLSELVASDPAAFANAEGHFPLLVKLLAPSQWLSVQVHPNDAQAAPHGGRGKHEAWCVLEADPDAEVLLGFRPGVTAPDLERAIAAGDSASWRDILQAVRVAPGDVIDVPPGTVHALGPGLVLVEVQQPSDTTFRVYDWNRPGLDGAHRPLHLPEAREVLDLESRPPVRSLGASDTARQKLLANDHFRLERWVVRGEETFEVDDLAVLVTAHGAGEAQATAGPALALARGRACLAPRGIGSLRLAGDSLEVLVALPPRR